MAATSSPLEATFFAALEMGSPAERAAYLDQACGDDLALRRQVERMLAAEVKAGSFLEAAAEGIDRSAALSSISEGPGTIIGRYKLLEEIAEGGMGVVYRAEQLEPVRRTVALKIIKPGMDTREVIARFESERQALAMMDHPNIARVFDAGETESGRSYFAMELVDGNPLTEYCDQKQLAIPQRLELFAQVCLAVQHAHQKGIIHRDLKPSNILVAFYDGVPLPKIIDFGIAKAVHLESAEAALTTGLDRVIGTPLYMSPEQAGGSGLGVDTRSDIYSLGVMLYELLTGTTPFDQERAQKAGYDEIRRMIRDEEPPRPSARISTLSKAATTISTCRSVEPAKLSRLLRGDLDWIALRALEKDPARRYQTATDFARDIEHYLANEPVQAGPPGSWYRARKFVRRYRAPLAIATGFVALLMAITIVAVRGYYREAKMHSDTETARRQAENDFKMARDAVKTYYTKVADDRRLKLHNLEKLRRDLLQSANEYYEKLIKQEADDPDLQLDRVDAQIARGNIESEIGDWSEAEASYKNALSSATRFPKIGNTELGNQAFADIQTGLFRVYWHTGRFKDAESALKVAMPIQEKLVKEHPDAPEHANKLATSYLGLGICYAETGQTKDAEVADSEVIRIQTALVKEHPDAPDYRLTLSHALGNRGIVYEATGRTKEAEAAYKEAIAILKSLASKFLDEAEYQTDLATYQDDLSELYQRVGRNKEAEVAEMEALAIQKTLVGSHPNVPEFQDRLAGAYLNLGTLYRHTGRTVDAEAAGQTARSVYKTLVEKYPEVPRYRSGLSGILCNLGLLYMDSGRAKEAEAVYDEGLAIQKGLVDTNPGVADYQHGLALFEFNLGLLYNGTGRTAKAEAAYAHGLAVQRILMDKHPDVADYRFAVTKSQLSLAALYAESGRTKEADAAYTEALRVQNMLVRDVPNVAEYRYYLAESYMNAGALYSDTGRAADAENALEKALAILRTLVEDHRDVAGYQQLLANTYYDLGCAYAKPLAKKEGGEPAVADPSPRALAARALEYLELACDTGWFDDPRLVDEMKHEDDLDSLRDLQGYGKLLERIAARAKPHAKPK